MSLSHTCATADPLWSSSCLTSLLKRGATARCSPLHAHFLRSCASPGTQCPYSLWNLRRRNDATFPPHPAFPCPSSTPPSPACPHKSSPPLLHPHAPLLQFHFARAEIARCRHSPQLLPLSPLKRTPTSPLPFLSLIASCCYCGTVLWC